MTTPQNNNKKIVTMVTTKYHRWITNQFGSMSDTITNIYIETGELVLELIIATLALDRVEMFHGSLFKIEDGFGDFVEVRVTVYYFLR